MIDRIRGIAENLRKSRQLAELTLFELSLKTGICERRLTRIENSTADFSLSELFIICEAIRVSPNSLISKATRHIRPKVTKQSIEEFITIKEAADILGVSDKTIIKLCKHKEMPYTQVKNAYLFRWTELDHWLDMQFNKRLSGKERRRAIRGERLGIEPLLSEREIKEIFGGTIPTHSSKGRFVPVYYIGRRKKYRLSDVLAYLNYSRVDPYDVPRFDWGWRTKEFNRVRPREELSAGLLAKKFTRPGRKELVPGFEWASSSFTCNTIEEAEDRLRKFKESFENKCQLAETSIYWDGKAFVVDVDYMRVPADWAGYRVVRTNKRSDFPNQTMIKVQEFIARNVSNKHLIKVRYYTDIFFGILPPRHCATIFYYEPINSELASDPGTILNPKAKEEYKRLIEEATIKVPKRIMQAISDLRQGNLTSDKLIYLLREANLYDRMEEAGLLVRGERSKIVDMKEYTKWDERQRRPFYNSWGERTDKKFARLKKMSAAEDKAFEEEWARKKEAQSESMRRIAAEYNTRRREAVERAEQNYQTRLQAFGGADKVDLVKGNLSDEDWGRLVWLQKYWDQVFIVDGRRRERPTYFSEWEQYDVWIFDRDKLTKGWNVKYHEVRDVFKRLIEAGAIFCQVYSGIVEINPCLEALLKEVTGEDKKPMGWNSTLAKSGARMDTFLRPDAKFLAELVEKYSNLTLGRIFGVSDNAVKKWMKNFGITRKRRIINLDITEEEILQIRKDIQQRLDCK